jgi:probable nitrogen fixation protein FixT
MSPSLPAPPEVELEIARPPCFEVGDKVRAIRGVRNDGTYLGFQIGEALVEEGEIGYVASVDEFLQRHYIYSVDFYERGRIVGMRAFEIECIEVMMKITLAKRGATLTVYVTKKDLEEPVVAQEKEEIWGGWIELANGWRFELPEMAADTRLPLTVDARRLAVVD